MGSYCIRNGRTSYCSYGCCWDQSDYCCDSWIYARWWFWVIIAAIALIIAGFAFFMWRRMVNRRKQREAQQSAAYLSQQTTAPEYSQQPYVIQGQPGVYPGQAPSAHAAPQGAYSQNGYPQYYAQAPQGYLEPQSPYAPNK